MLGQDGASPEALASLVLLTEMVTVPLAYAMDIDGETIALGAIGLFLLPILMLLLVGVLKRIGGWLESIGALKLLLHLPHLVRGHPCFCYGVPPPCACYGVPLAAPSPQLPVDADPNDAENKAGGDGLGFDEDCVLVPRRDRHRSRSPYRTRSRGTYQTRLRSHA